MKGEARSDSIARILGVALAAFAVAAALWSFLLYDPGTAPDYALNAGLLYRLELAVAALLLVAIPAVFIGHLLAGRLPRSVGKSGVDFGDYARAEHDRGRRGGKVARIKTEFPK
jgi:hypothetical protein